MIGVNLIPHEVRRRQAVRRRLRRWAFVAAPASLVALIPFVTEYRQRSRAEGLKAELAQVERTLRILRRDVTATAAEVQDTDMRIARARTLRTKRSWSGLLAMVGRCMPEEVWLTSLSTEQAGAEAALRGGRAAVSADAAKPAPGDGDAPVPVIVLNAATRLQLTGFALNHERLYDLMSRLKEVGAFKSVELVKAGMEPALDGRAVKFVLACGW